MQKATFHNAKGHLLQNVRTKAGFKRLTLKNTTTMPRYILTLILLLAVVCAGRASMQSTQAERTKAMADKYYDSGAYPQALTYYIKGMEAAEADKDDRTYMACIGNIANIYEALGDYESNLFYLLKGYKMSQAINDNDMRNTYLINIVSAYCHLGNVKKAKEYYDISLRSPGISNSKLWNYFMKYNSARISQAEGDYDRAVKSHTEAIGIARRNGLDSIYVLYQESEIGNINVKQGAYEKAVAQGNKCMGMSLAIGSAEMLVNAYGILSKAYTGCGSNDSAQKYRNMYLELSDSVFHAKGLNEAKGRLKQYETRKNDEAISLLNSRISVQTLVITLISALFAVSVILVVMLVRKNHNLRNVQRLLISRNNDLMKSDESNKILMSGCKADDGRQQAEEESVTDSDECQEMTTEQMDILLTRIIKLTNDIKIISDPDLSLKTIADLTGSNTKYVSFVINKTYGKNFRTFINEKRIREACKMLADNEHYGNKTIQAVYEEVGYTNAVSFIRAFKKINGMTPAMYKKLAAEKS